MLSGAVQSTCVHVGGLYGCDRDSEVDTVQFMLGE